MLKRHLLTAGAIASIAPAIGAQQASFAYRLGKDTAAVEQFTRTATSLVGEVVRRVPTILRQQYEISLGVDGKPTRATIKQRQADGTPIPNQPTESRFTFIGDSVRRENVFADSTSTRMFGGKPATFMLAWPSVATAELLFAARAREKTDSFAVMTTGGVVGAGLAKTLGDTMRVIGGPYPFRVRFDAQGRLQSVDGFYTSNKIAGIRAAGGADIAALAAKMTPMGVASARGTTSAGFGPTQSPIVIDYGRPKVRERTVWGGELVPTDSIWRAGANAATHLSTTRTLTFGDLTVPPGIYTLWVQHGKTGTSLIISKSIGIWGTQYDPTQDFGRAPLTLANAPEFVEELTITVKQIPPNRGTIEIAWGPQVATATFGVK